MLRILLINDTAKKVGRLRAALVEAGLIDRSEELAAEYFFEYEK